MRRGIFMGRKRSFVPSPVRSMRERAYASIQRSIRSTTATTLKGRRRS
jgi:hypothetical protein